ncbi:hypothetical protein AYK20_04450 [Thermoplasmatales archaeon SG8-52-1]|nr:MAG: hypothetical protein AYK20_04450 [Thermoplasmatales archaeon SG8-52-1]
MQNKFFKKGLVVGIIIILIGVSVASSTGRINLAILKTTGNDGSLLGYVNDTSGNPIEGALIRVHFHETYEEDYSDEDGYYHVFNIPICYCMKNATCSKEGYKTDWELLSIAENTTHDFVLTSGNNPPNKPVVDGPSSPKMGVTYDYTFYTTDPEDDNVSYYIDWGDGIIEDWIGPFTSGETIAVSHAWYESGWYTLRCKAKDHPYEDESDWLERTFKVPPKSKENAISKTSNSKVNCPECQSNDKTHLAEKLITRLEKNKVLSNVINLKNSDDRPICILLDKICKNLEEVYISLHEIADSFPDGSIPKDILEETAHIILVYFYARIKGIWAFTFNCGELSVA